MSEGKGPASLFCAGIERKKSKDRYILKIVRRILQYGMD